MLRFAHSSRSDELGERLRSSSSHAIASEIFERPGWQSLKSISIFRHIDQDAVGIRYEMLAQATFAEIVFDQLAMQTDGEFSWC